MCNTEMLLWWKEWKSLKTAFKWGMWKPPATLRAGCALLLSSRSRQAVSDSCSEEHAAPVSISSWGSAAWGITQSDFPVFHLLPPSAAMCFLVASFFSFFLRKVVETPPHRPGSPESYCDCHPGCTLPSLPFPGTVRQPLPLGPIKSLGPDSEQGGPFGSRPMAGWRWSLAVVIFYATPAARRFNRRHCEPQSLLMGFFCIWVLRFSPIPPLFTSQKPPTALGRPRAASKGLVGRTPGWFNQPCKSSRLWATPCPGRGESWPQPRAEMGPPAPHLLHSSVFYSKYTFLSFWEFSPLGRVNWFMRNHTLR